MPRLEQDAAPQTAPSSGKYDAWGATWGQLSADSPDRPPIYKRVFADVGAAVALHVLAFIVFLLSPATHFRPGREIHFGIGLRQSTPLVFPASLVKKKEVPPPKELTQKDPNVGKVTHSLDVTSALPPAPNRPRIFQPPVPLGGDKKQPAPVAIENAPDLLVAPVNAGTVVAAIPSLPKPPDPAKSVFQNLPPPPTSSKSSDSPIARVTKPSATEALRASTTPGTKGAGGIISDGSAGDPTTVGIPQLLSDAQGVDFKPYLLQVLNVVRRNWFGRVPEVARTGRAGQTVIAFSIDRNGGIPKLVIANASGTTAYDLAAVGSVSASTPLPPLPPEFRGQEIRLQMAFSLNLPRSR